jgi:hypothetical protein
MLLVVLFGAILATGAAGSTADTTTCWAKDGGKLFQIVCPAPIKLVQTAVLQASRPASSRATAFPLGSTGIAGSWRITINSVSFDAASAIQAASSRNAAPPTGTTDVMANVTITYTGFETGAGQGVVAALKVVGQSRNVGYSTVRNPCGPVIPSDLGPSGDLTTNQSFTGNVCYQVSSADVPTLALYWDAGATKAPWWAVR